MSHNWNQTGVGTSVAYGKDGARVRDESGAIALRNNADSGYAVGRCADPVGLDDVVNLRTLQQSQAGLFWKEPAALASTANVNIAAPGTTIDGQVATTGDRILLKNQTAPVENGVYIFDTDSTPMVRADDFAVGDDVDGAAIFIQRGTVNADTGFVQVSSPGVVGTDDLSFIEFASIVSGVTSVQSVGGGTSLVNASGPPTAEIRSLIDGSQIAWTIVGGNQVGASLQNNAVSEANLGLGVGVRQRFTRFSFSDMGNVLNIGAALPLADNVSLEVYLVVTQGFVAIAAPPTAEVYEQSDAGTPLQDTALNDLTTPGTYKSDDSVELASNGQLQLNLQGTASAGEGYVVVTYSAN